MSDPEAEPGEPPPWAGAPGFDPDREEPAPDVDEPRPGYQRADFLPPHAPMPGSPPYPTAEPVAPAGPAPAEPPLRPALGAAGVWLAVNLVLWTIIYGYPGTITGIFAQVAVALVAALITWLVARRRQWRFWQLVLVAAPFYWVIRLLVFPRQPL